MKHLKISVQHRKETGTSHSNRMRREGLIPAVIYGSSGAESITVNAAAFRQLMRQAAGGTALVDITIDNGKQRLAVVQKVERHMTKDHVLHVDFHELSPNKPMHIALPVHVHGEAEGVRFGGIIDVVMHSIAITCLPKYLQEGINLDVSKLNIGDSIHVHELPKMEGITFNADESSVVVSCVPPKITAEPEVEETTEETVEAQTQEAKAD